jgi:hypothetical protein
MTAAVELLRDLNVTLDDLVVDSVEDETSMLVLLDWFRHARESSGEQGVPDRMWRNRASLFDAYKCDSLYGIAMPGVESWQRPILQSPYDSASLQQQPNLPAFCIVYDDPSGPTTCAEVWVHPSIRRQGLARLMLRELNVRVACYISPESSEFWRSVFDQCSMYLNRHAN